MAYPSLQFVDSVSSSAALRYDFNTSTATFQTKLLGGGDLDLGVPTFTGEPGGVGAYYGYRQMRFVQRIIGTKATAIAKMSALAKELFRANNWLRYQHDAGRAPVFFCTYRTEPGTLSLEWSETAGAWDIGISLYADNFAYGTRVTAASGIVFTPNSTATNPMRYVLPAIKGDAPSALRITINTNGTSAGQIGSQWMVGCASGDATMTDPYIEIGTGDIFTATGGTAAGSASANYSNGSKRDFTVSAATPSLLDRLSGTLTTLVPGRYKVLFRCELDGTAGGKTFTLKYASPEGGASIAPRPGNAVTVTVDPTRVFQGWVDLGDFTFPWGVNAPTGLGNQDTSFYLQIGTSDNTAATGRMDAFKFIPIGGSSVAHTQLLKAKFTTLTTLLGNNDKGTFDGDLEEYWQLSSTNVFREVPPELAGSYPQVDPAAAQNVLLVVPLAGGTNSTAGATGLISSVAATASIDASYYPRYLYIGDGT